MTLPCYPNYKGSGVELKGLTAGILGMISGVAK